MSALDSWVERVSRRLARRVSRRGLIARTAAVMLGGATVPLLPVARARADSPTAPAPPEDIDGPEGDPLRCEYWRHCAIDGFLCGCCGGTIDRCPPGTDMSPVTWLGTCRNPADGKDYIVSYNDCCGKRACARCFCNRNEGERPMYQWHRNNDINWCVSARSQVYNCSVAVVVGLATEPQPER